METPSPYQSPASQMNPQAPSMIDTMVPEPGAIRSFGVIHLVVAGLGILQVLYSLLSILFIDKLANVMSGGVPSKPGAGPDPGELMTAMMDKLAVFTYLSIAVSVILIVMLTIAGFGLLKSRESGRVMSVRYAWTSIITKIMALIYTVLVVIPVTKEMTAASYQGGPPGMDGVMDVVMQAGQLISVLITFIYPIVVLCVMNGRKVRDYLAAKAD
jgi:hypothetical protein